MNNNDTIVGIYNLALHKLAEESEEALVSSTEDGVWAKRFNTIYLTTLKSLIISNNYNFSIVEVSPALRASNYEYSKRFKYTHSLPNEWLDTVSAKNIHTKCEVEMNIYLHPTDGWRGILTNEKDIYIRYKRILADPKPYPQSFHEYIAIRLALQCTQFSSLSESQITQLRIDERRAKVESISHDNRQIQIFKTERRIV